MDWAGLAEERIVDAMHAGAFDNLPGAGKPLDLDDYFKAPEQWRMAYGLLRSNGYRPYEVELMADIVALRALLTEETDPAVRRGLLDELREREVTLDIRLTRLREERRRTKAA